MTERAPVAGGEIEVAAACNEGYALPLAVMLASLEQTLGAGRRARVHVLERGLAEATKERIARSLRSPRIRLVWVPVPADRLGPLARTLRPVDPISLDAYSRLLLPELLPPDLDKVVYLDCDLVLVQDLGELWQLEPGDADLLAAAELDPGGRLVSSPRGVALWRELGLPPDLPVFNSGVMVVNLRRWRENLLPQRVFHYVCAAGEHLRWYDQEGLNAMVAGRWGRLDPRWNVTMHVFRADADPALRARLSRDPYIVHFNAALKPWQAGFRLGFAALFRSHLEATAWAGSAPASRPWLAHWTHAGRRAIAKRSHAAARRIRAARHRLRRWAAGPVKLRPLAGYPVPAVPGPEIRLFALADRASPHLGSMIAAHLGQGADRALVAGPGSRLADLSIRPGAPIHLFEPPAGRERHEVLRQLLERFGQGHWCLVLEPDELLVPAASAERPLFDLTRRLDAAGEEALACLIPGPAGHDAGAPPPERITTLARDGLSGRVFPASFLVDPGPLRSSAAARSRVVLLRYRPDLLIASDFRAVHGAKEADLRGVVLRIADAATVPDPGLAADAPCLGISPGAARAALPSDDRRGAAPARRW